MVNKKLTLEEILDGINDLGVFENDNKAIQLLVEKMNKGAIVSDKFKKAISKNVSKIMKSELYRVYALCDWLESSEYNMDDKFRYGSGDRKICHLGNFGKRKVMYMENQNMQMVLVLEEGYEKNLHVRLVYPKIENCPYIDVDEFREKLKGENGVEHAIEILASDYHQHHYADVYPGNEYPSRIDLDTMIKNEFKDGSVAFRYNDGRDENYIFSTSLFDDCDFTDKLGKRQYLLEEVIYAIYSDEIPEEFYKKYLREEKIKQVIG